MKTLGIIIFAFINISFVYSSTPAPAAGDGAGGGATDGTGKKGDTSKDDTSKDDTSKDGDSKDGKKDKDDGKSSADSSLLSKIRGGIKSRAQATTVGFMENLIKAELNVITVGIVDKSVKYLGKLKRYAKMTRLRLLNRDCWRMGKVVFREIQIEVFRTLPNRVNMKRYNNFGAMFCYHFDKVPVNSFDWLHAISELAFIDFESWYRIEAIDPSYLHGRQKKPPAGIASDKKDSQNDSAIHGVIRDTVEDFAVLNLYTQAFITKLKESLKPSHRERLHAGSLLRNVAETKKERSERKKKEKIKEAQKRRLKSAQSIFLKSFNLSPSKLRKDDNDDDDDDDDPDKIKGLAVENKSFLDKGEELGQLLDEANDD